MRSHSDGRTFGKNITQASTDIFIDNALIYVTQERRESICGDYSKFSRRKANTWRY